MERFGYISDAHKDEVMLCLNRPTPRVELGLAVRGVANSAIDVSDGLRADLQHILEASGVGAHIEAEKLPLSAGLKMQEHEKSKQLALSAGDDYELCWGNKSDFGIAY